MRLHRILTIMMVAMSLATAAHAQFDPFGGGGGGDDSSPPWANFHLDKTKRITLDFRNASPNAVIQYLSLASGIPFVVDPSVNFTISLQSPKPVSITDALAMLNAVL